MIMAIHKRKKREREREKREEGKDNEKDGPDIDLMLAPVHTRYQHRSPPITQVGLGA